MADRTNETLNIYDKESKLVVKGDKGANKATITGLKHGQVVADGDYQAAYQDVTTQAESDKVSVPGWTVNAILASIPGLKLTPGDGKIDVTVTASADDGGSAIKGYNVYVKETSANWPDTPLMELAPNALAGTIDKLTNGTDYTVAVTAVNGVGETDKTADGANAHATPVAAAPTKPDAPADATAKASDQGADVTAK